MNTPTETIIFFEDAWTSYRVIPVGKILIVLLGLSSASVSFAGSMIAWSKLNGRVKDFSFNGQHIFNILLLVVILDCNLPP